MDTAPPPRILPLPVEDRDDDVQALLDKFGPTVNIYATMARRPDLLGRCIPLGRALRRGRLSAREREIVILRTGWRCGCAYEWAGHAWLGRAAGMDDADLARITEGPDADGWQPNERALLTAADELHEQARISDATWSALAAHYDDGELIEITMMCGYYHLIAYFLNSLGVALEEGAEGAERFPTQA
jgi:alkylhydroperoxidase family enzyme